MGRSIRDYLKGKIPDELLPLVRRSFDIIGDIAILEIPEELEKYEKVIAEAILKVHKNVKVVAKKAGKVEGTFRIRPLKIILGERRTETIHKESGLRFALDVSKCYYTERLANERLRIAKQVKENEEVLVMFSGVNPYPIYIAKYAKPKIVYAVELNPYAVYYALINNRLNKVENKIITILGDVRDVCPIISFFSNGDGFLKSSEEYIKVLLESKLKLNKVVLKEDVDIPKSIYNEKYIVDYEDSEKVILMGKEKIEIKKFSKKFDRIVMPLPKHADTFLDVTIPLIKDGGIIHLYQFAKENEIEKKAKDILDKASKKLNFDYEILNIVTCGNIAPREYRVCIDFRVWFKKG